MRPREESGLEAMNFRRVLLVETEVRLPRLQDDFSRHEKQPCCSPTCQNRPDTQIPTPDLYKPYLAASGNWNVISPYAPSPKHGNHSSSAIENNPTPA